MKTRPWPIVILAILHLLAPIGNLVLSAWMEKVSVSLFIRDAWRVGSPLWLFNYFLIFPIAAFAIYQFKRWSYPVFFVISAIWFHSNYQGWATTPGTFPLWMFIGMSVIDVALVGYFLLPSVRAFYLDPSLRWWESKPRYRVNLWAFLESGGSREKCLIMDFSEGGVFMKTRKKLENGTPLKLSFRVFHQRYSLEGTVVYSRKKAGVPQARHPGYGVRFNVEPQVQYRMKKLVKALEAMGATHRNQVGWQSDFVNWVKLLPAGQGWIPKVPRRSAKLAPVVALPVSEPRSEDRAA